MSAILDKLKKNCRVKEADVLADSKFFGKKDLISTPIPMLNVALSGEIDGGLTSGLTIFAGPSKHFKTLYSLILASAYLKKYPEAVLMFYDTEFGSPQSYFTNCGIDLNRVLHIPIKNIEELKFDLINQLEQITRKDKVIIIIDSIGNIASKKELDDAIKENSAADMSRAKALKGLFRMTTPYLSINDIPMLAVNHSYQTQEMFSKQVMSGGTGPYYSASTIFFVGRQQDKVGTEIQGYHYILNVEKSRYVKEKSKIPISVSWEGGIEKWSGLLDVAKDLGYVKSEKQGWYCAHDPATATNLTGNLRAAATMTKEFWEDIVFAKTDFADAIKKHYSLSLRDMLSEDHVIVDTEEFDTTDEDA